MRQLRIPLTTIFLILLVGCENQSTRETSPAPTGEVSPLPATETATPLTEETPSPSVSSNPSPKASPSKNLTADASNAAKPGENQLISAKGIGQARVGMTLGQLKQLLGDEAEFQVKSPFIVDFDAIAIIQGGKEQYYILYPAGAPMADTDIIEALVTDNPNYQTAEGVGAGTPLKKAEAVYGDATLSYHLANESREYVKFAKHPSEDIAFRLGAANDGSLAGIYTSPQKEFNETKQFKDTATIRLVEVYCGKNCPLPPLPGN